MIGSGWKNLPTPPDSAPPRRELCVRKTFIAQHDPWAKRILDDVANHETEEMLRRSRAASDKEAHRRDLEQQIAAHQRRRHAERDQARRDARNNRKAVLDGSVPGTAEEEEKLSARRRRAEEHRMLDEQLQQIQARRRAAQEAASREAREFTEHALRQIEEDRERVIAKRREQSEFMKHAVAQNEDLKKRKMEAKEIERRTDVQLMNEYTQLMDEQSRKRMEQQERHRHKAPVGAFASADRFDSPRYVSYFESVDDAARRQAIRDATDDAERKRKAKQLAAEYQHGVAEQIFTKTENARKRMIDASVVREAAEKDAMQFNDTISQQRLSRRQRNSEYAKELKLQMLEARQRELTDDVAVAPQCARPVPFSART